MLVATILYAFCVASFGTMMKASHPQPGRRYPVIALSVPTSLPALGPHLPRIQHPHWPALDLQFRLGAGITSKSFAIPSWGGGWPAVCSKVLFIAVIGSIFYSLAWRGMKDAGESMINLFQRLFSYHPLSYPERVQPDPPRPPASDLPRRYPRFCNSPSLASALSANVSDVRLASSMIATRPEAQN